MELQTIDHICLWVCSASKAKDYYEKLFGFSCHFRGDDFSTLVVESGSVHFFIKETDDANFLDKQHLSFKVSSLDDVINRLQALGISNYEVGEVDCFSDSNYRWCEWRDPDGIRLECVERI